MAALQHASSPRLAELLGYPSQEGQAQAALRHRSDQDSFLDVLCLGRLSKLSHISHKTQPQ